MKTFSRCAAALAMSAIAMSAQAQLFDRGGGMVYDSQTNLTWLQDWSMAPQTDWATAKQWADNLSFGGYDDWRLPVTNIGASSNCGSSMASSGAYWGFDCTGSELGRMFYVNFGGQSTHAVLDTSAATPQQVANLAMFRNVVPYAYWTGTEYAPNPASAWYFGTSDGAQFVVNKFVPFQAVAVRVGDVTAVPEPGTWAMLAGGLAVITLLQRRSR